MDRLIHVLKFALDAVLLGAQLRERSFQTWHVH